MKKFTVLSLLLLVSINTYGNRDYNLDKIPALKTNSFIWGQVAACVHRFEKYVEFSSESDEVLKSNKKVLNNITGNTGEMYNDLKKIGYQSGFIGRDSITLAQWESMISGIAESEHETGNSWFQAVGCLKMLGDYKVFDKTS